MDSLSGTWRCTQLMRIGYQVQEGIHTLHPDPISLADTLFLVDVGADKITNYLKDKPEGCHWAYSMPFELDGNEVFGEGFSKLQDLEGRQDYSLSTNLHFRVTPTREELVAVVHFEVRTASLVEGDTLKYYFERYDGATPPASWPTAKCNNAPDINAVLKGVS
jgi:hypothetical protein